MGKAKKRNFQNCINGLKGMKSSNGKTALSFSASSPRVSRADAILEVLKRIKDNDLSPETKDLIGLFGMSAEELSEAGATYEELKALGAIFI